MFLSGKMKYTYAQRPVVTVTVTVGKNVASGLLER